MSDFPAFVRHVLDGKTLDADAAALAFGEIMAGRAREEDIATFLLALAKRNPTIAEITGAARAMRAAMTTIEAPSSAIDLCGTGGDGLGTLNISTAVSFVAAACGVPVAKHGNRGMSSKSGAADVLEKLGVKIDLSPDAAAACLREVGLCFLFAQTYHPAMKYVANVRRRLGIRTIFNLLGPVSKPARVKRQLLGVYARELLEPLAHVLKALGAEKAWVVHGYDGLDELTTTDITQVAMLEDGVVGTHTVSPEDAGIARAALADLKGGDADENAAAIRRLFGGEHGAYRDIVLFNTAAALIVAGKSADLRDGAVLAANALDNGSAMRKLAELVAVSNEQHG
jgi:anthranilate phosphoribosyltransferase